MNGRTPSYYRARFDTFQHFIKDEFLGYPQYDKGKNNSSQELLRQGFVHTDLNERFDSRTENFAKLGINVSKIEIIVADLKAA